MKLTRCLVLLSLAAIVCAGPGLAQDQGERDTMWFEVADWPIKTGVTSDTSVAIELWVWTDDSLAAVAAPLWLRLDMSDCDGEPCGTERWSYDEYTVPWFAPGPTGGWRVIDRWATSIDSLFDIDTFIYDPGLPPQSFKAPPTISSIHVWDSLTNYGYNAIQVGLVAIWPEDVKVLPTETRTKIGDLYLTVNLENDGIMPDLFDMLIDSTFYPVAGVFKFSHIDETLDSYQPHFIPGVVHVSADPPKDVGGTDPGVQVPMSYDLSQNFPNPFNPTTTIKFSLETRGFVDLSIYNILGRKVKTLLSTEMDAGPHDVLWDGTDDSGDVTASGIYFYKLEAGDFVKTKKMLMLK